MGAEKQKADWAVFSLRGVYGWKVSKDNNLHKN